jgi:phenylacetate-coenzyme A ligase PaaK-like adenylate-forming protein
VSVGLKLFAQSPLPIRKLAFNAYAGYLHYRREGRPLQEAIEDFDRLDRSASETIRDYQLERINELLKWATKHVPYYRGTLAFSEAAAHPIRSLGDLERLPVLTRATIREAGTELFAEDAPRYSGHTSGTTGSPLSLAYDMRQRVWNRAAEKLVRLRAGLAPDAKVATVWGRQLVPPSRKVPPFWVRNWPDRELWLSAFHIHRHTVRSYFDAVSRFGATALETYPSIAHVLAVLAREENIKIRLHRVLTTSETLFPFQRDLIQEVFGAEVFDYYGQAERVAFAIECSRHAGLHLLEAYGYVEPQQPDRQDGIPGLIATGLTNRVMPLIRYQIEDATSLIAEECSCGLKSRRLSPVTTKKEDVLVGADGNFVSPSILTHPFKVVVGVIRSQLVQTAEDHVQVLLEVTASFDAAQERQLRDALKQRLGQGMAIELTVVDEIPRERSGKFRWVINKAPAIKGRLSPQE